MSQTFLAFSIIPIISEIMIKPFDFKLLATFRNFVISQKANFAKFLAN